MNEISVCVKGKHCSNKAGNQILKALKKAVSKCDADGDYEIKKSRCFGLCKHGPIVVIGDEKLTYGQVRKEDCGKIVKRHAKKKKPLKRLFLSVKKK